MKVVFTPAEYAAFSAYAASDEATVILARIGTPANEQTRAMLAFNNRVKWGGPVTLVDHITFEQEQE